MSKRDTRYCWLRVRQMRLEAFFLKLRGVARFNGCILLSGIIYTEWYGFRWQDTSGICGPRVFARIFQEPAWHGTQGVRPMIDSAFVKAHRNKLERTVATRKRSDVPGAARIPS